jgi:hypothetical protein
MPSAKVRAPAAVVPASRGPIVDRPYEGTGYDNASQTCLQQPTIQIVVAPCGQGRFVARLAPSSRMIVTSSSRPFVDSARRLLELGYHPNTILEMSHLGAPGVSWRATLRSAVRLDVKETAHGPKFVGHRPRERGDNQNVPDRPYSRAALARAVPHQTLEIAASASSSTVDEGRQR